MSMTIVEGEGTGGNKAATEVLDKSEDQASLEDVFIDEMNIVDVSNTSSKPEQFGSAISSDLSDTRATSLKTYYYVRVYDHVSGTSLKYNLSPALYIASAGATIGDLALEAIQYALEDRVQPKSVEAIVTIDEKEVKSFVDLRDALKSGGSIFVQINAPFQDVRNPTRAMEQALIERKQRAQRSQKSDDSINESSSQQDSYHQQDSHHQSSYGTYQYGQHSMMQPPPTAYEQYKQNLGKLESMTSSTSISIDASYLTSFGVEEDEEDKSSSATKEEDDTYDHKVTQIIYRTLNPKDVQNYSLEYVSQLEEVYGDFIHRVSEDQRRAFSQLKKIWESLTKRTTPGSLPESIDSKKLDDLQTQTKRFISELESYVKDEGELYQAISEDLGLKLAACDMFPKNVSNFPVTINADGLIDGFDQEKTKVITAAKDLAKKKELEFLEKEREEHVKIYGDSFEYTVKENDPTMYDKALWHAVLPMGVIYITEEKDIVREKTDIYIGKGSGTEADNKMWVVLMEVDDVYFRNKASKTRSAYSTRGSRKQTMILEMKDCMKQFDVIYNKSSLAETKADKMKGILREQFNTVRKQYAERSLEEVLSKTVPVSLSDLQQERAELFKNQVQLELNTSGIYGRSSQNNAAISAPQSARAALMGGPGPSKKKTMRKNRY